MYKIGDIIKGTVTGVEKYGIFVKIDKKYNGLIHISEVSDYYVKDINDYVKAGDIIECKILDIDNENMQMKLSIKTVDSKNKAKETGEGFKPLKEKLKIWIEEKTKELSK
ncbi:MAG TPA: S1 RNA-binding domain-containing protein [Bacilli bacterium]|nr:S1 RNA-binding domain-containing protein [Bacilli bacterium]